MSQATYKCFAWWPALIVLMSGGCVVHRHDATTGVDTLYGFGVMRVRATPPLGPVQASGVSVETSGISLLWGEEARGVVLGLDRRQRLRVFDTAAPLQVNYTATNFWRAEVEVVASGDAAQASEESATGFSVPNSVLQIQTNP